jgi:AcrR family transcriptional regulator
MSRPQSITDDEILAAARAVFLDRGVTATVEEVATRCGVGEATVFRRFPTKQALFLAAMDTGGEPEWIRLLAERKSSEDVRGILTEVANQSIAFGRKMTPLILMKLSNPAMMRERTPARLARTLQALTEFFEAQIKAGRVHARDPRVAARIWIGSIQHITMFEVFTKTPDPLPADTLIEGLVDMFCAPSSHITKS